MRPAEENAQRAVVRRRTLTDQVVEYLLDRIRTGEARVGQKLPTEKELTEALSVSRTCVREALKSLESLRLIRIRPRIGAVVLEPSATSLISAERFLFGEDVQETDVLLEFRMIIEVGAASLAAQKANEYDLLAMETALQALERELAVGNLDSQADISFHGAIAAASKNPMAVKVWEMISPRIAEILRTTMLLPNVVQESLKGHALILRAIKQRNPSKARAAMRTHLETADRIWRIARAQSQSNLVSSEDRRTVISRGPIEEMLGKS